jgi:hypothetical protein
MGYESNSSIKKKGRSRSWDKGGVGVIAEEKELLH